MIVENDAPKALEEVFEMHRKPTNTHNVVATTPLM